MATAVGWAPIVKSEKRDDGTLVITGRAASSAVDRDYQIADERWLDTALGKWFGDTDGGNIREQHDGHRAVGTAISYKSDGHEISAEIVDPVTIRKIERNVLKGFSWSARNARVKMDKAAAGGRIVGGDIYEVSVVDRPANPECLFTIAKADGPDGDGELELVDEPELVEVDKADAGDAVVEKADEPRFTPTQFAELLKGLGKTPPAHGDTEKTDDVVEKKDFSQAERDTAADKGHALPDGSFPIETKSDLGNAVKAFGRAKDPAAAKRHIIKRARALDAVDQLPDDWGVSKAFAAVEALEKALTTVDGLDLSKVDAAAAAHENLDIADGKAAIACIARLIMSEASELAEGHLCEIDDIQMLISAACALQCFIESEAHEVSSHMPPSGAGDVEPEAPVVETAKADTPADTAKTDTAVVDVIEKTDAPAAEAEETLTKTDLSNLLKETIAKAVQPYKDELDAVKGQLAKVLETPRTDGPARLRTTTHTAVAAKADQLRAEIAHCQKSIPITSGDLRKGYRQRLEAAEAELTKLDGAAA